MEKGKTQLSLRQLKEEIGLILLAIHRAIKQPALAILIESDSRVVSGRNLLSLNALGQFDKLVKLQK
jgi:hypothetical protein